MLPLNPTSYEDLNQRFVWNIPQTFNIGFACSDAIALKSPDKPAIIDYGNENPKTLTFKELAEKSSQFASALEGLGIRRGDRVAIMLPQSIEAAIAHLGVYKLGAITVPLAMQFGPHAMQHRLQTAGATALVADPIGLARAEEIVDHLPALQHIISVGAQASATVLFDTMIEKASPAFSGPATGPDDPAMMLFTSGTTGQPKGALHGHRVLLGHLPGIQMAHDLLPQKGDLFWTPSDWAWAGGLLNALLPALYFGVTVVAARAPKFEPEWAIELIKKAGIKNIFMPPTALKLMQSALEKSPDINLRSLACAGEALGRQSTQWAREILKIEINEFYGQTECNAIIGASHALAVNKAGSMGKAVPGHDVVILKDDDTPAPDGEIGEIAIDKSSPVMFLEYFDDRENTAGKFSNNWLRTGDLGIRDSDGYFHFVGRNDDVITSAGYRIGPAEIEDCLVAHPAIELAAVIGMPDEVRTEIIAAYVKLSVGNLPTEELESEIRTFVKTRLSAHEYPRIIEFVDHIPLTESGKIIRRHFKQ